MVYLASKASFSVNLDKVKAADVRAAWINPRNGKADSIGRFPSTGVKTFTTPDGWEDALLILEAGG
jgi:hypothetical protein